MRLLEPAEDGTPASYGHVAWLFLRLLGLAYLFAFLSLEREQEGLFGPDGLAPAGTFVLRAYSYLGGEVYRHLPSIFWLPFVGAGRVALHGAALTGAIAGGLVVLGFWPRPLLVLLWALYLSFMSIGQVFLGYQWDSLLVETGLLSILVAPGGARPRAGRESEPAIAAVWLLRILLFRLMLSSGLVKLLSGDPTWRNLTALTFHYETQPLPTWIGYSAHQLPVRFQKVSCAVMFAVELVAPFFVFAGRRLRFLSAAAMVNLQAMIAATGNYCFFNLLTVALCLTALDDGQLPVALRRRLPPSREGRRPTALAAWTLAPAAVVLAVGAAVRLTSTVGLDALWPEPLVTGVNAVEPFGVAYPYGLFAVMTTSRLEIEVQGSRDGSEWRPYAFRWKPGDVRRRPGFVAPFQPRLDWQMWFAALETCDENPWLSRLFVGLVNDEPAVLALLQDDPFGTEPPRAVRAVAYDYRFTDLATLRQTGAWWRRRPLGLYCPPVWASPSGPSARRGEGGEAVRTADGSSVPANVGAAQRAFLVGDSVLGDVDGQPVAAPGLANDLQQPLGVDFPAEVARSARDGQERHETGRSPDDAPPQPPRAPGIRPGRGP
jgi:lipase maturation factor 1